MKKSAFLLAGLAVVTLTGVVSLAAKTNKITKAEGTTYSITFDKNSRIDGSSFYSTSVNGNELGGFFQYTYTRNEDSFVVLGDGTNEGQIRIKNSYLIYGIRSIQVNCSDPSAIGFDYGSGLGGWSGITYLEADGSYDFGFIYENLDKYSFAKAGVNGIELWSKNATVYSLTITYDCVNRTVA